MLPMTNLIFSSQKLLGSQSVPFDKFSVISMVVITIGMFFYGGADLEAERSKQLSDESAIELGTSKEKVEDQVPLIAAKVD